MKLNLNNIMQVYLRTGKGLDLVKEQIAMRVYSYPKHNQYCSEEDCADFLLGFYPRIERLIERYENTGSSFEAYLQSCLSWHMKSYIRLRIHKKREDRVLYKETCQALLDDAGEEEDLWEVREETPRPFAALEESLHAAQEKRKHRRQIMLLALKCADSMNDENINQISSHTGIHSSCVFHLIEILRTTMRKRTERIRSLEEGRRRTYLRLRYLTEEKRACQDEFLLAKLNKKIRREKKNYETAWKILAQAPKAPSHSDIARILGIPKGTVDTGFHYIKKGETDGQTAPD
jgi:DNA-directed RNA polymerase specialized sigma24 family protein